MMLNSPRIRSPKGSPRNNPNLSIGAQLGAGFLRHFKLLLLVTIGITILRLAISPSSSSSTWFTRPQIESDDPSNDRNKWSTSSSSISSDNSIDNEGKKDDDDYTIAIRDGPIRLDGIRNEPKPSNQSEWNKRSEGSDSQDDDVEPPSSDKSSKSPISPSPTQSLANSKDTSSMTIKTKPTITETTNTPPKNNENMSTEQLLQQYNASLFPLIPQGPQQPRLVQVHLIVDVTAESGIVESSSKFLLSAVERSDHLQAVGLTLIRRLPPLWTQEMNPRNHSLPLLYLIDWGSMNRDCHRLQLVMESIQSLYETATTTTTSTSDDDNSNNDNAKETSFFLSNDSYMLLTDFSGSTHQTQCDFMFQQSLVHDKSRIRLAKRSIVQGRYYNHQTNEINLGTVLSSNQWQPHHSEQTPILHSPLVIRETFVNSIWNATRGGKVEKLNRSTDVGFFWNNGDYSHYGFYRRDIAKVVKTLHHSKVTTTTMMENTVGLAYSDIKGMGAGNIQFDYVRRLLDCKIVVVTQRDEYEDHYRLMESLAAGALVMTDAMLAMPSGLQHQVNVIVYNSPNDLKKLIRYYIHPNHEEERKQIALQGLQLVMGRHRCWHRLEELIFGQPRTNAFRPNRIGPKKEQRASQENSVLFWVDENDESSIWNFV